LVVYLRYKAAPEKAFPIIIAYGSIIPKKKESDRSKPPNNLPQSQFGITVIIKISKN